MEYGGLENVDGTAARVAIVTGGAKGIGRGCALELASSGLDIALVDLLDDELARRGAEPRCAILVIDLRTGDTVHWARFTGVVKELYDVAVLPGIRRPAAIGFKSDEIRRVITIGDAASPALSR